MSATHGMGLPEDINPRSELDKAPTSIYLQVSLCISESMCVCLLSTCNTVMVYLYTNVDCLCVYCICALIS